MEIKSVSKLCHLLPSQTFYPIACHWTDLYRMWKSSKGFTDIFWRYFCAMYMDTDFQRFVNIEIILQITIKWVDILPQKYACKQD